MPIRDYNFVNGPTTPTLPTASTPVAATDLTTKSYVDNKFSVLAEGTAGIGNAQSGANINDLIAPSTYRVTRISYFVIRVANDTVIEAGMLTVLYDGTNFHMGRSSIETPTTAGISFDINSSTGQVTYSTSTMAGSYDTGASLINYSRTYQGAI